MGHINFNNLVRIKKKQAEREMKKISKPANTICEACRDKKHIKVEFRTR